MERSLRVEFKTDLGKWSVKKNNFVNVKKILLFEARHKCRPKEQILKSRKF